MNQKIGHIEFLSAGLYTTIQDNGREGNAHFGVPLGGAMDKDSMNIANRILDNDLSKPVVEFAGTAPKILFKASTTISIAGAILQPFINKKAVSMFEPLAISDGDVLSFGRLLNGYYGYIAFSDQLDAPKIFNSYSVSPTAKLFETIKTNKIYDLYSSEVHQTKTYISIAKNFSSEIRCFRGPEYTLFDLDWIHKLIGQSFSVSSASNRMAMRLHYEKDNFKHDQSILSSAVLPGTVQLTPNGDVIVLMRDAQTTGGYPRILQLSEDSINNLAQIAPNKTVNLNII